MRKKQIEVTQSIQSSGASSTNNLLRNSSRSSNSKMDLFSNDRPPTNNNNNRNSSSSSNLRRPATTSYTSANMFDRTQQNSGSGERSQFANTTDLSNSFTITEEEVSENFFMPKKKILRQDGASLLDVYRSKQEDTWGKIIKAQYLEDEEKKLLARKKKEEDNEEYARRLKQQLDEIHQKKLFSMNEDSTFAQLEDATVSF